MRKWASVFMFGTIILTAQNALSAVRRVDWQSPGNGPGTSSDWSDSFNSLQAALTSPLLQAGDVLWVADGTYKPSVSTINVCFTMKPGVNILGGFAGVSNPANPDLRNLNPATNNCVISGALSGATSLRLIVANDPAITRTTILEGFTIRDADASQPSAASWNGGGILVEGGAAPTVRHCRFMNNSATYGGAAYIDQSDPEFRDCAFIGNSTDFHGGAMMVSNGQPNLVRCSFISNTAVWNGGAIQVMDGGAPTIFNCVFESNTCGHVGGGLSMRLNETDLQTLVVNCLFIRNGAGHSGGGARVGFSSNCRFVQCTFVGNYCLETDHNLHGSGGGLSMGGDQPPEPPPEDARTVTVDNCIFWNNQIRDAQGHGSQIALVGYCGGIAYIRNCDIMDSDVSEDGLYVGTPLLSGCTSFVLSPTNIVDGLPGFVTTPNAGTDGDWGTSDDVMGDVHLASGAAVINRGDCSLVPNDLADVDDNSSTAGVLPLDLGLVQRRIDRVDMGAYEHQTPQHPTCPTDVTNGDGVGVGDLLAVITAWGPCPAFPAACPADISPQPCTDGAVGVADLLAVITTWGTCNGTPNNDAPTTVAECMTFCGSQFAFGSPEYQSCLEKCCSTLE